jgi:hypothetical protein
MAEMKRLGAVLNEINALNWQHALYLPFGVVWDEMTSCAVLDPNESEELAGVPPFAKENGIDYALGISAIQDIVANVREQRPAVETNDLTKAFLFYFRHDAFIIFALSKENEEGNR